MRTRVLVFLTLLMLVAPAEGAVRSQDVNFQTDRLNFLEGYAPVAANYLELGLMAYVRTWKDTTTMTADDTLAKLAQLGQRNMRAVCGRGDQGLPRKSVEVTHYYMPLLKKFDEAHCHTMEGVCRFWKDGVEYIGNYQKPSIPVSQAFCKNGVGYGMNENCTHPCRSLAANRGHHHGGEIIFFPELVGKVCGTGTNRMIHDGFMVVNDTGDPKHFNREGRFDFYWGACKNFSNGVCHDPGAEEISRVLGRSQYCRAWRPQDPTFNSDVKLAMYNAVRTEAIARGDNLAAGAFDLDAWTAPTSQQTGARLAAKAKSTRKQLASAQ